MRVSTRNVPGVQMPLGLMVVEDKCDRLFPKGAASRLPHPIPYQGSKRNLASRILDIVDGTHFRTLYEPFAGSAAITLAAASRGLADEYRISDSLASLMDIWQSILSSPDALADAYSALWHDQLRDSRSFYDEVRSNFNTTGDPVALLYLLARCVKNAPRFNRDGQFNQSPDKRRLGMRPEKMREQLRGASVLLAHRTVIRRGDFGKSLQDATPDDLVYLDPPYEGTSTGTDKRYHAGLTRDRLITVLNELNARGIPFLLSYDGRSGDKVYGPLLPESLNLMRLELHAGRSSQATLNGRTDETVESLYLSRSIWSASWVRLPIQVEAAL